MREVIVENLFVGGINIDTFSGAKSKRIGNVNYLNNAYGRNKSTINTAFKCEADLRGVIDLTWVTNEKLIKDFERHVRSEREEGHLVLCHIIEIENRKLYLDLGYTSMNRYLVRELKYSDDVAYAKIKAAQLLRQNPEISQKVLDGDLKITQLQKVTNAIKAFEKTELKKKSEKSGNSEKDENLQNNEDMASGDSLKTQSCVKDQTFMRDLTKDILSKIENKTLFETEMILAKELNIKPTVYQKITPQADDSVLAKIPFTKEQYETIQKAQDLMSHVVTDKSLADAIEYLAKFYIKTIEGKSSKVSATKKESEAKSEKPEVNPKQETKNTDVKVKGGKIITPSFRLKRKNEKPGHSTKRKYISVKIRRAVFAKAQNCCEYLDEKTKRRCDSRYQLQIDHITPLSRGGTDTSENLRVLCGVHNRHVFLKWGLF